MYNKKAVDFYNQGRELQQKDQLIRAEKVYRKAISKQPDFVEAYNNLGNILVDLKRLGDAVKAYRKAVELMSDHPMLLNNLGNALQLQDKNEEAIVWFKKALSQNPNYADAYNNLGNALYCQNDLDEALHSYHKVISIDPVHKEAHIGLGHALSGLGEISQAIASYRKAIEIDPENAEAYRSLSKNKKFTEYDSDIQNMEVFYNNDNSSSRQRMHLAVGLGKAYEDIGKYKKSMEYILEATRLKRAMLDYSISKTLADFNSLKKVFSETFFVDNRNTGYPDQSPIFVLGMPRSGTSLTEQILASHSEVYGAGELSLISKLVIKTGSENSLKKYPYVIADMSSEELSKLGYKYIESIRKLAGENKYITDKMPHNFQHIGFIKAILPNAKIVHCTRDPMDNCLSIFKNYFTTGHQYSYDMTELGQYYKLYQNLMRHWEQILPGFIYHLSYENLIVDQETETRKLLEFCGLPWEENCLSFHKTKRKVNTASNAQVRQPIYKDSVKLSERYGDILKPLQDAIYGS